MPIISNAVYPDNNSGIEKVLEGILSGAGQGIQENKDRAYRKAAAKLMGVPESDLGYFKRDEIKDLVKENYKNKLSPKGWKPTTQEEAIAFEKAKASLKSKNDIGKTLIGLLGDMQTPESVLSPEQIEQVAPKSAGPVVGGGEVLESPGHPGEYLPGYEPTPQPSAIADMLRQKLGVTKDEAIRKNLGLPQKEVTTVKNVPRVIGIINKLKEMNAPTEDIMQAISFEGYDPKDYEEFFISYQPKIKHKKIMGLF